MDERQAAQSHIDALAEPRRSQMQRFHDIILGAVPTIDVRMWDYGPRAMIGHGTYPYSTSRGAAGDWFAIGLASRKAYICCTRWASAMGATWSTR